jgi:uncharacterized membrane protein YgcG
MLSFARVAAGVAVALLVVAAVPAPAAATQDFGTRTAGRQVFDRSGRLTAAEVAALEARATDLGRAGAPTIVYVRLLASDQAATRGDARELMDAWQVESAAGARDGLVAFVNLTPSDPQHGAAALYSGSAHVDDGRLSAARLQDIFDHSMRPLLAEGDVAGGLAAGLEAARVELVKPGPNSSGNGDWFWGITLLLVVAGGVIGLGLSIAFAVWAIVAGTRRGSGWTRSGSLGAGGYAGYTGTSVTDGGGSSGSSSGDSGSSSGGGGGGDSGSGGASGGGSF